MKFSILIPSRNRPVELLTCIESIYEKAAYYEEVEILVRVDYDDPQIDKYIEIKNIKQSYNFSLHFGPRLQKHCDYYNNLCLRARGIILWGLCDDTIVETDKWDAEAIKRVSAWKQRQMEASKNYSIWYGDTKDNTRNFNGNGEYACFPMMSNEAYLTMGYLFHPENISWGSDKWLKYVFEQAGAGIIDISNVFINHNFIQDDETHQTLFNRLKANAGQECGINYQPEIERLRQRIKYG